MAPPSVGIPHIAMPPDDVAASVGPARLSPHPRPPENGADAHQHDRTLLTTPVHARVPHRPQCSQASPKGHWRRRRRCGWSERAPPFFTQTQYRSPWRKADRVWNLDTRPCALVRLVCRAYAWLHELGRDTAPRLEYQRFTVSLLVFSIPGFTIYQP